MRIDRILNNRGQNIIEYTLILGIVVLALSAMQTYVRRGIQAGIKIAADELGPQEGVEETDPDKGLKTASSINTQTQGTRRIQLFGGGRQQEDIYRSSSSSGGAVYESTTQE